MLSSLAFYGCFSFRAVCFVPLNFMSFLCVRGAPYAVSTAFKLGVAALKAGVCSNCFEVSSLLEYFVREQAQVDVRHVN